MNSWSEFIRWEVVDGNAGPAVAYHAGAVIGDYLFIHGGISNSSEKSQVCRNSFYKIQVFPLIGQWTELTSAESPFLSQHQCIPHYPSGCLCFVGGWTGKARSAGVHIFDANSGRHSLVPMIARGNQVAALVLGREGSLRTQRRISGFSNENESGDLGNGQLSFVYTEIASSTASRSYHTTTPITAHEALVVGGRTRSFLEIFTTPNEVVLDVESASPPVAGTRLDKIGMRGHYAISGGQGVLIGGGEGFNALRRDPQGEAFICLPFASNSVIPLGKMEDKRCYAVCAVNATDGTAWLQGGLGSCKKPLRSLARLICAD
ncbi:hypothetical protein TcWFU_006149 [Taenia crassiceps]|uniref:Uncharacterized protein n=1 Tax=Taenia crassiceps TaxID=6207 RepID=A0ABR4Q890_9CEST